MIHYTDTTVFNVNAQTIVNTVNCVGVMGSGLALEFQLRFPKMEQDYVERCKRKEVKVGKPYLYKDDEAVWIINFPTKNHWKYPSKIKWIEDGLIYFANNYKKGGITSAAFPKLGCSHGGLDWHDVSPLMEKYLCGLDIEIFICLDQEKDATGIEGLMVQLINDIERVEWDADLKLRSDIKQKIIQGLPIRKFRDLGRIEGIGKQTYRDTFKFLYELASQPKQEDSSRSFNTLQLPLKGEIASNLDSQKATNDSTHDLKALTPEQKESDENIASIPEYASRSTLDETISSLKPISHNSDDGNKFISSEKDFDAFFIILPYMEQALIIERTKDEISEMFKIPKSLASKWLELAEKLGKIKKLTRPVRYVSISSQAQKQLEFVSISNS